MAVEDEIIDAIVKALEAKAQHVANIVIGPKREEWFNAESFVAVSHRQTLEASSFIVYGEQAYKEALKETPLRALLDPGDGTKIPDLVGYSTAAGRNDYDVAFVLEAKVVYRSEEAAARATALKKLRDQLERAKRACPAAVFIGVVYLVAIAGKDGVVPEPFLTKVKVEAVEAFAGVGIRWLREPSLLTGMRLLGTSFPSYPSAHVSVGVGALALT